MKYLEQRIEELELELKILKAKNKLEQIKTSDHMYNNSSINLLSEPDLETCFVSPWNPSETYKNPLNTVTVNLSSTLADNLLPNSDYVNSFDSPYYYPDYPNILGSWEDTSTKDDINDNITDEYGFKMNHDESITSWKFTSSFDKADKDFLNYLNTTEKRIEKDFGKIISKFRILNHEWEMDGYGYVVRDLEYNKNVIITNHGKPIIVDKSYLNDIISEYKEIIQETERALFLVK